LGGNEPDPDNAFDSDRDVGPGQALGQDQAINPDHALAEALGVDVHGIDDNVIAGGDIVGILPETRALFDNPELAQGQTVQAQVRVNLSAAEYTLLVRLAAQFEETEDQPRIVGYVLTFDDITALLSAQRQAAWAEVARRIAHEIKNPLTPIQLSAERLGRKFEGQIDVADRSSFSRSINTIIRQVDVIGRLIREFSAFARMPGAQMQPELLSELVNHAVELQAGAWPALEVLVELEEGVGLYLDCDAEKVSQALTNVLQNAAQAMADAERDGVGSAVAPVISIRVVRGEHELALEVADNGPGFPAGERHRFLEPYVTTKVKGTGLGLAIVHKIMEEHSGRVELDRSDAGGALVRLVFPAERIVKDRPRRDQRRAG